MGSEGDQPTNVKLRKGRWFWEPSARLRQLTGVKGRPLGTDQPQAWAYARKLNAELAIMQAGANAPGTVAWVFGQFFSSDRFNSLARFTQTDYRRLAKCRRRGRDTDGNRFGNSGTGRLK